MPNRILKESIKTSEEIDALSWFEECFFYRLIVSCDDYGRYSGNPVVLKNTLFPTKESVTVKAIEDASSRLQELGLLYRYDANGKVILQIATWTAHQQTRAVKSKYPDPPAEISDKLPQEKRKRGKESDRTCNQMISDDSKCDQEISSESKCPRNRIRNRDTKSYSINENGIEGSATRAREPVLTVDNLDATEEIRIVPGESMRERGVGYANV